MANDQMARDFVARSGERPGSTALTRRVMRALRHRHDPALSSTFWKWCYLEELRVGERRLDGWAINASSGNFERRAYEVKVTRGDYFAELSDPNKRAAALSVSNRFYFVVPAGMLDSSEVPAEAGLIEAVLDGPYSRDRTRLVIEAPWRDIEDPPLSFVCELARRVA